MSGSIKNIFLNPLRRKKIHVFIIFFFISILLWTLIKLSNTYTDTIEMNVKYTNLDADKILLGNQEKMVSAQIKTTGFRMLRQKLFNPDLEINLKRANKKDTLETYYVLTNAAIDKHLYQDIEILRVAPDTLYMKLGKNITKTVPVTSRIAVTFQKGFNLYDSLRIVPKTIKISGPEDQIAAIDTVFTQELSLTAINSDIDKSVAIVKNDSLNRIKYHQTQVKAVAKVEKFTEGKVTVPLRVDNLPNGYSIKLFPKEVTVIYTANVSDFNTINASDFSVRCDYNTVKDAEIAYFVPEMEEYPKTAKTFRIEENKINFLIKK